MNTITVWLLVMTGGHAAGGLGAVQPHLFPTEQACAQVAQVAGGRSVQWRCVQTTVVKP